LIEHSLFKQWHNQSGHDFLWLCGGPGTGKTFLLASAVEHLLSQPNVTQHLPVLYFFCNNKGNDRNKVEVEAILRSLIFQLWQQFGNESRLSNAWNVILESGHSHASDIYHMTTLFQSVLRQIPKTCIVIDALDECFAPVKLLDILRAVSGTLERGPKVLVASRPRETVAQRLESDLEIKMSPELSQADLVRYTTTAVTVAVQRGSIKVRRKQLSDEIVAKLTAKAEGMFVPLTKHEVDTRFLWIDLQLQAIANIKPQSDAAIRSAMIDLPVGLENTYQTCFARINASPTDQRVLAQRIFWWLACSKRPMRLVEVVHASKIERGTKSIEADDLPTDYSDILMVCSDLVHVVDETLEFIHSSVRDMLLCTTLRKGTPAGSLFGSSSMAHEEIALACLTYLSFRCFEQPARYSTSYCQPDLPRAEESAPNLCWFEDDVGKYPLETSSELRRYETRPYVILRNLYPLLDYASKYWFFHVSASKSVNLCDIISKFLQSTALTTWVSTCSIFDMEYGAFPSDYLLSVSIVVENIRNTIDDLTGVPQDVN